jgi:hypothetical protein
MTAATSSTKEDERQPPRMPWLGNFKGNASEKGRDAYNTAATADRDCRTTKRPPDGSAAKHTSAATEQGEAAASSQPTVATPAHLGRSTKTRSYTRLAAGALSRPRPLQQAPRTDRRPAPAGRSHHRPAWHPCGHGRCDLSQPALGLYRGRERGVWPGRPPPRPGRSQACARGGRWGSHAVEWPLPKPHARATTPLSHHHLGQGMAREESDPAP